MPKSLAKRPMQASRLSGLPALIVAAMSAGLLGCSSTDKDSRAAQQPAQPAQAENKGFLETLDRFVCSAVPNCMNIRIAIRRIQEDQQKRNPARPPQPAQPANEPAVQAQSLQPVASSGPPPLLFPRGCAESSNAVVLRYIHLKPRFQAQRVRAVQNGRLANFDQSTSDQIASEDLPVSTVDVNGTAYQLMTCAYPPTERWMFWRGTAPPLRACDIQAIELDDRGRLLADIALPRCPLTAGEARSLASIRVDTE